MPREFHLDKTHIFSLFLNTLSCHPKCLCNNLFNVNKTQMKLPPDWPYADFAKHDVLDSEEVRRTGMPLPLCSSQSKKGAGRGIRTAALAHTHLETTPVTSRDKSLSCLGTPSAPFNRG